MKQIILCVCFVLIVTVLVSCSSPRINWVPVDETEHFSFLTVKGAENAVPLLAKELEANYDRITADLQVTAIEKFPVYIFENLDTFHRRVDILARRRLTWVQLRGLPPGWYPR